MKTIYVATDSRGTNATTAPGDRITSWTEQIKTKYNANWIMRRSAMELPTHHIYDIEGIRNVEDGSIDLAILQTGMYTGIDYCSEGVFKALFGYYYKPDGLKHFQPDVKRFIYTEESSTIDIFNLLQKKCKRVAYIGLHILTRWHLELRQGREWNPTYNELAELQNKWYASMVTDYVPLPWTEEWVDTHTFENEFLHYTEPGVQFILDKLNPIVTSVINS